MNVQKVELQKINYAIKHLRDNLSWGAIGLLYSMYLNNFNTNSAINEICKLSPDSRYKTMKYLSEIEKFDEYKRLLVRKV